MPTPFPALRAQVGAAAPALLPVTSTSLTATKVAELLVAPPPQLLVDCGGLLLPHPLGVCHLMTQLLQLRQRGTCLRLCNVHPGLRRYLHALQLAAVLPPNAEAPPTGAALADLPAARTPLTHPC